MYIYIYTLELVFTKRVQNAVQVRKIENVEKKKVIQKWCR